MGIRDRYHCWNCCRIDGDDVGQDEAHMTLLPAAAIAQIPTLDAPVAQDVLTQAEYERFLDALDGPASIIYFQR